MVRNHNQKVPSASGLEYMLMKSQCIPILLQMVDRSSYFLPTEIYVFTPLSSSIVSGEDSREEHIVQVLPPSYKKPRIPHL